MNNSKVQENQIMRDEFLGKPAKYLDLVQKIIKEFCCLGTEQTADFMSQIIAFSRSPVTNERFKAGNFWDYFIKA